MPFGKFMMINVEMLGRGHHNIKSSLRKIDIDASTSLQHEHDAKIQVLKYFLQELNARYALNTKATKQVSLANQEQTSQGIKEKQIPLGIQEQSSDEASDDQSNKPAQIHAGLLHARVLTKDLMRPTTLDKIKKAVFVVDMDNSAGPNVFQVEGKQLYSKLLRKNLNLEDGNNSCYLLEVQ
ncbi:hypothetical protein ACH5RR_013126 [Cinchona calisaya]|uniref:Uncharacterized protein n=1 Tax=Cinchona calisaya TaxID=153742 RepID=A0ABD2ZZ85_9GENT